MQNDHLTAYPRQQGHAPGQLSEDGRRCSAEGFPSSIAAKFRGSCNGSISLETDVLAARRSTGGAGSWQQQGLLGAAVVLQAASPLPPPPHLTAAGGRSASSALHAAEDQYQDEVPQHLTHQQAAQQQQQQQQGPGDPGQQQRPLHPQPPGDPLPVSAQIFHKRQPHPSRHQPSPVATEADQPTNSSSGGGSSSCSDSSDTQPAADVQQQLANTAAAAGAAAEAAAGGGVVWSPNSSCTSSNGCEDTGQPGAAAAAAAPAGGTLGGRGKQRKGGGVTWAQTIATSSSMMVRAEPGAGPTAHPGDQQQQEQQLGVALLPGAVDEGSSSSSSEPSAAGDQPLQDLLPSSGFRRPAPLTVLGPTAIAAGPGRLSVTTGPTQAAAAPPPPPAAPQHGGGNSPRGGGATDNSRGRSRLGRVGPQLIIPGADPSSSHSSSGGGASSSPRHSAGSPRHGAQSPKASAAHAALRASLAPIQPGPSTTSTTSSSSQWLAPSRWLDLQPMTPRGLFSPRARAAATPRRRSLFTKELPAEEEAGNPEDLMGCDLRLHVITFNMADKVPHTLPPELLQPPPPGRRSQSSRGGAGPLSPSAASLQDQQQSHTDQQQQQQQQQEQQEQQPMGPDHPHHLFRDQQQHLSKSEHNSGHNSRLPHESCEWTPLNGFGDGSIDMYIIATQESGSLSEWTALLQRSVGPRYVVACSEALRDIHLVVLVAKGLRRYIRSIAASTVATGLGNVMGNKGGVGVSLQLGTMSLLLISSHLAAHDEQVKRRNADFHRIRTGLFNAGGAAGATTGASPHAGSAASSAGISRATSMAGGLLPSAGPSTSWPSPLSSPRTPSPTRDHFDHLLATTSRASTPALSDCSEPLLGPPRGAAELTGGSPEPVPPRSASCPPGSVSSSSGGDHATAPLAAIAAADLAGSLEACSSPRAHSATVSGGLGLTRLLRGNSVAPLGVLGHNGSSGSSVTSSGSSPSWMNGTISRTSSSAVVIPPGADATASHDVTLWCGDLNYRIRGNHRAVMFSIKRSLHEVLHANDQLRLQLKQGKVFEGFQEGDITFAPTFKFVMGSHEYHPDRTPSWTDRVLWKVRSRQETLECALVAPPDTPLPPEFELEQLYYTSVASVTSSDHKPVVAGFKLSIGTSAQEPLMLAEAYSVSRRSSLAHSGSATASDLQSMLQTIGQPRHEQLSRAGNSGDSWGHSSGGGGRRFSELPAAGSTEAGPGRQGCWWCCIM